MSITPPAPAHVGASEAHDEAREHYFGGARLLMADGRMMYLLLDHARGRAIARLFGIDGPNSALVTIIALALAADAAHRKVTRALTAPGAPSFGDVLLDAAAVGESVRWVAGSKPGDSPLASLVLLAVGATVVGPAVGAAFRGIRSSSNRSVARFDHRYGHLIRPSRVRARAAG